MKQILVLVMALSAIMKATAFRVSVPKRSHGLLVRRSITHLASYTNNKITDSSTSTPSTSNAHLVQQRLQQAREKAEARRRSTQTRTLRHLQVKQLLEESNSTTDTSPSLLYQLKVTVCDELRQELMLSGREKRGRVFCQRQTVQKLKDLQRELHALFRALRKGTYVLAAGYPQIEEDGTITAGDLTKAWPIRTDQDVVDLWERADQYFDANSATLKRPSLVVHVQRDPNAPPPPPPPSYLMDMPDPGTSPTITMLSFYSFPPSGIANPDDFARRLTSLWKPFQALGRIYVAPEGVNAQMSVPTNVLNRFQDCCLSIPELGDYMENGLNIDPVPLTREQFNETQPFTNLHIRVRSKIVADGLDAPLDWQNAGHDMDPLEWHARLKQARELRAQGKEEEAPIVLDFRNTYETDVGRFEGAEPLGTENFRDSWDVVKERLANVPKDKPIMMYCTGGIRYVATQSYF